MSVTYQSAALATLPAGTILGTETLGGVEYQFIKLIDPTAGSTTPIGVVGNPLKVDASGVIQPVSDAALAKVVNRVDEMYLALLELKQLMLEKG